MASWLFPFITPWTVWDIPYHLWREYAATVDAQIKAWKEQKR